MIHPFVEDFTSLKDAEIESKIQDLSKKYFQARNPQVQNQIILILEMYKEELSTRRRKLWEEQYQKRDTDLDNLINVN